MTSNTDQPGFIPPFGNYQELLSYQKAEVVYDLTYRFCKRFLSRGDRTIDQMIQAARSGKQNIVEGSKASGTSKEMEIKLTNVARASLEELLVDFRDFLRVRDLQLWSKNSKETQFVRKLGNEPHVTYEAYREFCETRSAEVVANILPDSSGQLSSRLANPPVGARLHQGRWNLGADEKGSSAIPKSEGLAGYIPSIAGGKNRTNGSHGTHSSYSA
jgi:four helix bundle protein